MFTDNALFESQEIIKTYISKKDVGNEEEGVADYLKDVAYPQIPDFPKDLEWFNVSQHLSFTKQLKGKIVLLDFFTYCCINCMHILPDLKDIENEFSIEDGLVVIGVHSAKFENEKSSNNILAAVQRYNISHPVVNDSNSYMWKNCDIQCWPTLLLLGPKANPIVMLTGEGHRETLHFYIRASLSFYNSQNAISHHKIQLLPAHHLLSPSKGPLYFPGKITCSRGDPELIAISDTGNHRILILDSEGNLLHQVGGHRSGFKDGSLEDALFNAPQGLTFKDNKMLFVADTENHAIRMIDLDNFTVTTVAGVGEQGEDHKGGKTGKAQEISSPWDVALYKTEESKELLLIAMAGTHQIWVLFLDGMAWWKNQQYIQGTCVCIAGSGKEENRNNQYPHAAAFAQPSDLAVCYKNKEVYIADSESSSVRRLSLINGKVTPVVGGERDPNNLFAFGDKDGKLYDAKLQHILGLALSKDEDYLFVADTYNHKIKKVDIKTNSITTINLNDKLSEPGGLCTSSDGRKLFIADTNNHCIKILFLDSMRLEQLNLKLDKCTYESNINKSNIQVISNKEPVCLNCLGGKLIITINLELNDGLKLADGAPQNWSVNLPNAAWSCVPNRSGTNVTNNDIVISVPPENKNVNVEFLYNLVTCSVDVCLPKSFVLQQTLNFSTNSPLTGEVTLNVTVTRNAILIKDTIRFLPIPP